MQVPQPPRQSLSLRDLGFRRPLVVAAMAAFVALPALTALLLDASTTVAVGVGLGGLICGAAWNWVVSRRLRVALTEPLEQMITAVEHLRTSGQVPRLSECGAPILRPMLRRFNLAGSAVEQRGMQREEDLLSIEAAFDRVHAVLQSLREGVAVVDHAGRVALANRSARRILADRDRLEGALLTTLVEGELRDALEEGLAQVDGDRIGEFRASDVHDGATIYDLTIVQVQSNRPDQDFGKVVVLTDVTRNHEVHRLKDDLLSSISHELRTPLTNMCSSSEILATLSPEDEATWREFAEMLRDESHRLKSLVDDVMYYGQIDARDDWKVAVVDVGAVVRAAVESMRPAAEARQQRLQVDCDAVATAEVEPTRLDDVVRRIVENAIKFTPEGGVVRVGTTVHDGIVEVGIDDSGPGIAVDDRLRVFERFSQVGSLMTDKPAGTGLGLSIAQRVVDAMGGTIWCEESDLGGARFCFVLTLAPAGQPDAGQPDDVRPDHERH